MKIKTHNKNMLIGGLLAIVLVMAIGYAAFATSLNITSTSSITTTWDVEITGIELFASRGATDNAGSPTYNNSNGLTATFNTNLTSPGDYATYKIEVTNKGSLNAVLSSITGPTSNNNDITFYLNKNQNNQDITDTDRMIAANDILNPQGDSNNLDVGYVYVTVLYRDYEGQTSPTGAAATATATVTLNFTQSNSAATVTPVTPSTQTVYSWNTDTITVGTSQLTDLVSTKTTNPYYTSEADIQSALNGKTGSTIYNKYTVENDTITEGYACQTFGILSRAECIKMSTDGSEYGYDAGGNHTGNAGILKALQSNSTFTGASGSCIFDSYISYCDVGDLRLAADSNGYVYDSGRGADAGCGVSNDGYANCYEEQ